MNCLLRSIVLFLAVVFVAHVQGEEANDLDLTNAQPIQVGFTAGQEQALSTTKPQDFQAEVNRLMEIIINSLYKTRDIFLRELISNAVDALDKIRYQSLTGQSELGSTANLDIRVQVDNEARTITIVDTGIGMTAAELTKNLGTIAHSGTASFLDAFAKGSEASENQLQLIGQFGVGFYSAFLVADEVIVVSKSNKDPDQHVWRSKADGHFIVSKDPRGVTLDRGTAVILKIKEDAKEFLNNDKIESVIQRYSEFMQYPIYLFSSRKEEVEAGSGGNVNVLYYAFVLVRYSDTQNDELSTSDENVEGGEIKKAETLSYFWKRLNSNKPIWSRRPNEVTSEEYNSFYKAFTKDTDQPLAYTHFRAEGEIEFDSILYIPEKVPPSFYDNYHNLKSKLKLYVRRVLVADEFEDIVPRYLNFVKVMLCLNV
ncbi:heat shock protein 90 [Reticulomyxa filosa]|uniref:Heat shock protein 90 n=1 Tax=Reticulomyxa filosa TaxID=46433 RepID=X6MPF1_RETFI|nr:heat shock protein 90 [Reticulomyxa filosa]|eukprot:ETO15317.1 heat shock protein 90 [Reticulomyxa filosa]